MERQAGGTVRIRLIMVGIAVALGAALTVGPAAAEPAAVGPVVPLNGRWVVTLKDGADPASVASAVGAQQVRTYTQAITGFAGTLTAAQALTAATNPDVTSIEPSTIIPARRGKPRVQPAAPSTQITPTNIRRVGAPQSRTARIDSRDQRVDADIAVLDGGVGPHPEINLAGAVDCTGEGVTADTDGHGTLVAGVAAAIDNNDGVVGVAPGARIWSVRIFNRAGLLTNESLLCGLDWVRANARRLDVIDMSFGDAGTVQGPCGIRATPRQSPLGLPKFGVVDPFHFALCRIAAAGVTPVASAGNDATDSPQVPAAYPEVISVSGFNDTDGEPGGTGASTPCFFGEADDTFASFSNYGRTVDIAAPATCIVSTFPGGLYQVVDGTSFAAPHVAGGAALIRARQPRASPLAVRTQLLARAERGPIRGDPDPYPEGRLNVRAF